MAKKRRSKRPRKPGDQASSAPSTSDVEQLDDDSEVEARPAKPEAAAKRASSDATASSLPQAIVRTERADGPREPAFWFGFEVAWAKLAVARFVVFMLLAVDAALQVSHAPRYGAGGFNVGQLPFLDAIAPGRVLFGATQLVLAYMFVMVAFGIATRVLVPLCAAAYAWLYFTSQLDSYQHHYLVAIVLVIACFVPWQRPAGADPRTPVRSWALRLLLVQLAIVYLWAAISKLDRAWVDGSTLAMQMTGPVAEMIKAGPGFEVASVLVIAVELALAAMVWARPAWKYAAPLGVAFHLGIVFTGLEIGLFAFLMLGIYGLVMPDVVWIRVMTRLDGVAKRLAAPSWVVWGVGVAVSIALATLVRLEDAFTIAIAACVVPLGVAVYALARGAARKPAVAVGLAHVLGITLWLVIDRATSTTVDYYRFWGGSQRRIGSPEVAEHAYRRLTEVAPHRESGRYHLGRLLIKRGAIEEGLVQLREAQRLAPSIARSFVEEARVLQKQGKTAEAIEKAQQATYADPSHADARALLDSLTSPAAKPATPPTDVDEPE